MIGIAGTPAVGKRTASALLAKRLGAKLVDINQVARQEGLLPRQGGSGLIPDTARLQRVLSKTLSEGPAVVFGHLLPYVTPREKINLVVVLRCNPYLLMERYRRRGYGERKARENAGAEVLDLVLADSIKAFGRSKVAELDTTGLTPKEVVDSVIRIAKGEDRKRIGIVDWLTPLAQEGNLIFFFP